MFAVTTFTGTRYTYVHTLDAGEKINNSFDAISPDTQWMVSGEWGDQSRLQVFPTPCSTRPPRRRAERCHRPGRSPWTGR